ncbi:MAG: hypothetical protein R2864_14230 [Syntrophotaleaceae bacterium]
MMQKKPCNLLQLVEQTTAHLSWQHESHQFEVALAVEDSTIYGDQAKLRQLLDNTFSVMP